MQGFGFAIAGESAIVAHCHLTRIIHESASRDRETGNPLAGLSGAQRAPIALLSKEYKCRSLEETSYRSEGFGS
jgi:hypothetical protein